MATPSWASNLNRVSQQSMADDNSFMSINLNRHLTAEHSWWQLLYEHQSKPMSRSRAWLMAAPSRASALTCASQQSRVDSNSFMSIKLKLHLKRIMVDGKFSKYQIYGQCLSSEHSGFQLFLASNLWVVTLIRAWQMETLLGIKFMGCDSYQSTMDGNSSEHHIYGLCL